MIDIPREYATFDKEQKKALCNKIIDMLLYQIDRDLDPVINRITFLDEILEMSLMSSEEMEQYEICQCIYDIRKILNEN